MYVAVQMSDLGCISMYPYFLCVKVKIKNPLDIEFHLVEQSSH